MHALFLKRREAYDGRQIGSLWAYRRFGLQGDSVVAWVGACSIPYRHMIDVEDVRARAVIRSPMMLHFICEHFDAPPDLEKGVLRQRLFVAHVRDEFERVSRRRIRRDGDDLFDGDAKLSISISAVTPVSTKFHFGINVRQATGVGVKTAGLEQYDVEASALARDVMKRYVGEMRGIEDARTRARGSS